jgi:hypothetical protein
MDTLYIDTWTSNGKRSPGDYPSFIYHLLIVQTEFGRLSVVDEEQTEVIRL